MTGQLSGLRQQLERSLEDLDDYCQLSMGLEQARDLEMVLEEVLEPIEGMYALLSRQARGNGSGLFPARPYGMAFLENAGPGCGSTLVLAVQRAGADRPCVVEPHQCHL